MKILYIHQYFNTPEQGGSTRSYWISQELIKNGHEVVMITSMQHEKENITHEIIDGIDVTYLKTFTYKTNSIIDRLKTYTDFMLKSTKAALKQKNIDLVIATSTPLTIGFPALILKKTKKIPYLFEVRDLWPEVPIQMGALKNYFAKNAAIWFEKTIYKNATHIVALSPGMEDGVLSVGTKKKKVSMIPNMSKIDQFWPRPTKNSLIEKYNLKKDSFKIIYFGAIGVSNGIDYVLDGIEKLKDRDDIEFIFLGHGIKTEEIVKRSNEKKLNNVKYLGAFNMKETSKLVNMSDVSLVTFTDIPILYTNSPNKLFDSLSAGKPIIVNSPGWTKALVEENKCGIFVDPKSADDFASKIIELKNNDEQIKQMGLNSRKLAETKYDKEILCKEFVSIVEKINLN